ncbi:MAG: putative toxin-antitoxin system toxin component, PIN family [Thermofilum sp. ex4484_79]|nr:MAG: putative toxin-antitoxin system toxin component, PIN family [Thermofilum sp. ex4484_79]
MRKRVVVDTSVIVASVLGKPEAAPARVVKAMLSGAFRAYSSYKAMEELYEVLTSERIARLLKGRSEIVILVYILVNSRVVLVKPKKRILMCRDSDDNKFLEIAYEAKADCLVTIDKDLLDLRDEKRGVNFLEHRVKILRPSEFLEELIL